MFKTVLTLGLMVFLALFFISSAAGELYKWMDADGTVHYSDSPVDTPASPMDKEASKNSPFTEPALKKGWDQDNLRLAIIGCIHGMMDPNLESYRKRALEDGHPVNDDEMKHVKSLLYPTCNETCECVIGEIARKWGFDKFRNMAKDSRLSSEYQQYVTHLIKTKVCPLPILNQ